jgi:hypothetical protein
MNGDMLLYQLPDRAAVQTAIALRPRGPNRRALAPVQHPELQRGQVCRAPHDPAERIHLPDDGAFRDAANGGIARHLTNGLEGAGDQPNARAAARRGNSGFGPGVASPYDEDVELRFSGTHGFRKLTSTVLSGGCPVMPIRVPHEQSTLLLRKSAFERAGLSRGMFDSRLGLTAEEFQVEGGLIVVGPIPAGEDLQGIIGELEAAGLVYFEEFFELSGNWPEWLTVFVMSR